MENERTDSLPSGKSPAPDRRQVLAGGTSALLLRTALPTLTVVGSLSPALNGGWILHKNDLDVS